MLEVEMGLDAYDDQALERLVGDDPDLLSTLPGTKETAWPCSWDRRKGASKPKPKG